tara:strand:- start:2227 stop:2865 length:639 start_codon:yes stop_codon:yes gene_type:complete
MNVLELFSGTHSVGKVCDKLGWTTLSLDIDGRADITMSLLDWDYKEYPKDAFDIIWASPPCATFSGLQNSNLGRMRNGEVYTTDVMEKEMSTIGDPLVLKALEIIDYFDCKYWFMENPQTGRLKDRPYMKDIPYYDVDYCMYSDWGYKKRTRIWTNKPDFNNKLCDGKGTCGNMIQRKHKTNLGNIKGQGCERRLDMRYRIPEDLISSLFLD